MKREVYEPQRIYPKQIIHPQHITVANLPEIGLVFKQQIVPFAPYYPNRPNQVTFNKTFCNRSSHEVFLPSHPTKHNSAFVHLRNEISNLRCEFSKLIQNDQIKMVDEPAESYKERQMKDNSIMKRENRIQALSATAFYNKSSQVQTIQKEAWNRPKNDQVKTEYNSAIYEDNQANSLNSLSNIKNNSKLMGKSYFIREEATLPSQQNSKIRDHQFEISKMDQLRKKSEKEVAFLRKQLKDKQNQFCERFEEMKSCKIYLQGQVKRYEQDINKQKQMFQSQILSLQRIHQINLKEILSNYERVEQELQKKKQELIQSKIHMQQTNSFLQNQLQRSKKQQEILKVQLQQVKRKSKLTDNRPEKITKILQELKILRQENTLKQALINSLYRDNSNLDNEIRQLLVLKSVNVKNQKLIDELTQTILYLECQCLNDKFRDQVSYMS